MSLIADIRYAAKNFQTGLSDVQAIVFDESHNPVSSITLSEIDATGVYHGSYTSGAPQVVTIIVDSASKPAKATQKYALDTYDDEEIIAEIQEVASEVWEELTASHTGSGTFGWYIQQLGGSGFDSANDSLTVLSDKIDAGCGAAATETWDRETASHTGSGTFGQLVQDIYAEVGESGDAASPTGTAHAKLAEILARIGSDADAQNPDTLFEYLESIQGSPTVNLQSLQADLQSIIGTLGQTTSNIRYKVVAPALLERPEAGSLDHRYLIYILDEDGAFADPDGSHVWIEIEDPSGADIVASATLDRDAEGIYGYTYSIDSSHTLQQEIFKFHFDESAVARIVTHTTFVQDKAEQATVATMVADLSAIKGAGFDTANDSLKIISDEISQLQDGTTDGSTYVGGSHSNKAIRDALDAHDASVDSQLTTILNEVQDVGDVEDAVWDAVMASHLTGGTTGAYLNEILTDVNDIMTNYVTGSHSLKAIRDAMDTQLSEILTEVQNVSNEAAAVWEEEAASHNNAGTMGALVHTIDTELGEARGAGFDTASHSLVEIVADIAAHDSFVTTEFGDVKGSGFATASHSLKAIRDAINDVSTSTGGYAL
jgi:hypothetical protein